MLCNSGIVDDVMFAHGPIDMLLWGTNNIQAVADCVSSFIFTQNSSNTYCLSRHKLLLLLLLLLL